MKNFRHVHNSKVYAYWIQHPVSSTNKTDHCHDIPDLMLTVSTDNPVPGVDVGVNTVLILCFIIITN
jgi:hypothetical protein